MAQIMELDSGHEHVTDRRRETLGSRIGKISKEPDAVVLTEQFVFFFS